MIAANAPSNIEATATKTMICCHWATQAPNGPTSTRNSNPMAASFGADAMYALTGVGAPS